MVITIPGKSARLQYGDYYLWLFFPDTDPGIVNVSIRWPKGQVGFDIARRQVADFIEELLRAGKGSE